MLQTCIVLFFVYIYSEFVSGLDSVKTAPSPYQVRTKSAPSSLHACISLALNMHDNRVVYAVSMRVSRIINRQNPEPLSLPWSEQRAKEERTRSGEMPPKPAHGDVQS